VQLQEVLVQPEEDKGITRGLVAEQVMPREKRGEKEEDTANSSSVRT
jgi:hypothetical protein